jgi:hypothetical protein
MTADRSGVTGVMAGKAFDRADGEKFSEQPTERRLSLSRSLAVIQTDNVGQFSEAAS